MINQTKIPAGWKQVKLGDIGNALIGLTYSPKNVVKAGGTLVLRSSNIKGNKVDYNDQVRVDIDVPKNKLTRVGDILICARNGSRKLIGKNVYIDGKSANNAFGAFMSVYRTDKPHYISWFFQSNSYNKQISKDLGPTINQVTTGNLNSFKLLLPPLPEQEKIVEVLEVWDSYLEKLTKTIKFKKATKKGLMQILLSGKIRLAGFSDVWKKIKLNKASLINPKSDNLPAEFVYIDLESVEKGVLKKERIIKLEKAPSRAQRKLQKKDILFQMVRPYQKNNLLFLKNGDYVASTGYAQIRTQNNPEFLYYILHTDAFVSKVLDKCTGSNYPAINSTDLGEIEILLPSFPEQTAIAQILTTADQEIEALEKKKAIIEQQKKFLLNNLITGRIRLPDFIK